VAPGRMKLRDDGDVRAGVECLDCGPHPRAASSDNEDVVLRFHCP
jgi:hypothetical protein